MSHARRIAWFRPRGRDDADLDETAALVRELGHTWRIDLFDARRAHDFVWMHASHPYDLCVHELADTPSHAFVWPYLFHYPGLLRLRSATVEHGRAFSLERTRRYAELRQEVEFGGWDLLRAPVLASRLVVVSDDVLAARVRHDYGGTQVRSVPLGAARDDEPSPLAGAPVVRFGVTSPLRLDVVRRVFERARESGMRADLLTGEPASRVIRDADVVLALEWPPATGDPPGAALAAMAYGRAVIVLETAGAARWPALDPQTWQPRSVGGGAAPIAVSVDPRDEEHSLGLAVRRLASDPALIRRLGGAAHGWWREHATLTQAVSGWQDALRDAVSAPAPARPADWPAHLASDATGRARTILQELRVGIDFLKQPAAADEP